MKVLKKIETLADLTQDHKNARKHSPRNIGMISDSLREVGAARSGVIDEDGRILAGNGTFEALSEAGMEKVKVVEADGNEWVVVRRKGLSEKQKVKLALFDNRASELGDWDGGVMNTLVEEFPDVMDGMFGANELDKILDLGDFDEEEDPEIQFSEVMDESNNYVVLVFDNDIDWVNAQTYFDLKSVYSKRSNGKPWSKGIGRVVKGADFLKKVQSDD